MQYPDFSVSMCVYGGDNSAWFDRALKSVFTQTLPPTEIVLTVDGPIPNAIEDIINQYCNEHQNLYVVRLEKNLGHGEARRVSVENCRYNYIAIVDADDINEPNRFATQIRCFVENSNVDVVGSLHATFIDDENHIISINSRGENDSEIKRDIKHICPITQACVMFKKSIYEKAGGYKDWYCAEDYYLWIRMYEAGAVFYNCQSPLVKVRASEEQYKRRGGWKYFKSTSKISIYMYRHSIINLLELFRNVIPRFFLQVLCPSPLRGTLRNLYIGKSKER